MDFSGLNHAAVLLAAIGAFITGAAYYGLLASAWMKAADIKPSRYRLTASTFALAFACLLLMAYVLAALISHIGNGEVTPRSGFITALYVWGGLIVPAMLISQRYERESWNLSIIDGAHWLLVTGLMGAVIGFMGV